MVKRKSACAAQMHHATDAPVGAPPSRRHAPNAGACALVTAPTRFQLRQGGHPCSSCGLPPVVTVFQRGCGAQRSATVEASRQACSGLQRTTVPISGERATNLDEAAKRAIHTSTPREHATNSMTTARRHDTSENEPPSGGACKKAQRFNRCEGCPKAEEATGRLGGFNPIGKNQPDQKGLNPPDQVHTSPPRKNIHASDRHEAACDTENIGGPGHGPAPPGATASGRATRPRCSAQWRCPKQQRDHKQTHGHTRANPAPRMRDGACSPDEG